MIFQDSRAEAKIKPSNVEATKTTKVLQRELETPKSVSNPNKEDVLIDNNSDRDEKIVFVDRNDDENRNDDEDDVLSQGFCCFLKSIDSPSEIPPIRITWDHDVTFGRNGRSILGYLKTEHKFNVDGNKTKRKIENKKFLKIRKIFFFV
jgi:hypothetical protein